MAEGDAEDEEEKVVEVDKEGDMGDEFDLVRDVEMVGE